MFWEWSCTLGGGITWLRGSNGAGKTTLLKLLAGALTAQSGEICLNRWEIRRHPVNYRQHSFLCSSEIPDFSWLNLQEFLDLHLSLYPQACATNLNVQLSAFKLLPLLRQSIDTLSLGQQKKMYLALALALPVSLLLIDEPFNALDADAVDYLRRQLSDPGRLARQCILLTSHIAPDIPLAGEIMIEG